MPDERVAGLARRILPAAIAYRNACEEIALPAGYREKTFVIERKLAVSAVELLALSRAGPPVPRRIGRNLGLIAATVESHLDRWGWGYLRSPEATTLIDSRIEGHTNRTRPPYLDAYISALNGGLIERCREADRLEDEADGLGILGSIDPAEALKVLMSRRARWNDDPALGREKPAATDRELSDLATSIDRLKSWLLDRGATEDDTPAEPPPQTTAGLMSDAGYKIHGGDRSRAKESPKTPVEIIADLESQGWIVGKRSDLNEATNHLPTDSYHLERKRDAGDWELITDIEPGQGRKRKMFAIRPRDPIEAEEIRVAYAEIRRR